MPPVSERKVNELNEPELEGPPTLANMTAAFDGVYIGPADLTLGLSDGALPPGFDRKEPEMVAAIPQLHELNIGHFLMGEAMMYGLAPVVSKMLLAMDRGVARRPASLH